MIEQISFFSEHDVFYVALEYFILPIFFTSIPCNRLPQTFPNWDSGFQHSQMEFLIKSDEKTFHKRWKFSPVLEITFIKTYHESIFCAIIGTVMITLWKLPYISRKPDTISVPPNSNCETIQISRYRNRFRFPLDVG